MDFIIDNIYLLILAAAGIAQWLKATQEAKKERENPQPKEDEFSLEELEEFIGQAERHHPVPPPLPTNDGGPMPGVERSPVPNLKKTNGPPSIAEMSRDEGELARQEAIATQLKGLRQAKQARVAKLSTDKKEKGGSASRPGTLRSRLGNRRELRQAIVLREILDKPVGLR